MLLSGSGSGRLDKSSLSNAMPAAMTISSSVGKGAIKFLSSATKGLPELASSPYNAPS